MDVKALLELMSRAWLDHDRFRAVIVGSVSARLQAGSFVDVHHALVPVRVEHLVVDARVV